MATTFVIAGVAIIAILFITRMASMAMKEVRDIALQALRSGRIAAPPESEPGPSRYEQELQRRMDLVRDAKLQGD